MERQRTTTAYAILGLLSVREWTSYEMAKQVQRSLNWFWPRAERKLYEEPKRLAHDGLAIAHLESTGKRPRTVYRITEAGRDALRSWLGDPPAPRTSEFEGMVKVFFADAGTKEQLLATLDLIAADADQRLAALAEMAGGPVTFPKRAHISALGLHLQYEQETAVRRWAGWAREQVSQWTAADDPGEWDARAFLDELSCSPSSVSGIAVPLPH